jgi:twitching motility protein PilT
MGASDLFLNAGKVPAMRIRGEVRKLDLPPTPEADLEQFLRAYLGPQKWEHFLEKGDFDLGYTVPNNPTRYRLNLHRQRGQLGLVARALPLGSLDMRGLNLPESIGKLADLRRGLILVTGATGSGKSTTLAALLHRVNATRYAHIVTIEDPIEFVHRDLKSRVTQREVGIDTESFHSALRHVVRESPDVIMVGEIRDIESMSVAISTAMTGHLVLSSLHTIDAAQSLQRIIGLYPEHLRSQVMLDLSLCLKGIISQRLVPREGGGRVPAVELLTVTPAASQLIRESRIEEITDLMRSVKDPGIQTFNQSLVDLHRQNVISQETGIAYASNPDEFRLAIQGMEVGVDAFRSMGNLQGLNLLDMKTLLALAIKHGASDIHLSVGRPPIYRIVGSLHRLPVEPLSSTDVRSLLFSILSNRQRSTLELDKELDFSLSLENGLRFRVNAFYQKGHMAVALRTISSRVPSPQELGLPEIVIQLSEKPHGLVLVVGPTGSGKTTTLSCLIDRVNQNRPCHIITIEDPIEYNHASALATVDQREVNADTKSFSAALKYVLRQDPDVIMVGEMRDLETISAALTAAETGHLVFATLHTNDAPQTIDRIVDVFPPHQQTQIRTQLASALVAVISQRLLPRQDGSGRIAAFEVMLGLPSIRNIIREGKTHQIINIMETQMREGMITLDRSIHRLFHEGYISYDEAARHMNNQGLLNQPVRAPDPRAR